MDFNSLIQLKRDRFDQLEHDIADPALFSNRQRAKAIMRDHASIKQLLAKWDELEAARKQLDDNRCRRTKMKTATRSWKSEPELAEAKRPSSPPIYTVCIIAMQNLLA